MLCLIITICVIAFTRPVLSQTYSTQLVAGQTTLILSPNFSGPYPPNQNVNWIITAPANMVVNLNCFDFNVPKSPNCVNDRLIVSRGGFDNLADGIVYCGSGNFTSQSFGSRLVVSLRVPATTNGGRFACSVQATQSPASTCKCGVKNQRRIVGGNETGINEWPMMVEIKDGNEQICGGSIISSRYIVTAAHCLSSRNPTNLKIVVGEHDYAQPNESTATRTYSVKSAKIHENYTSGINKNDIALLQTDQPIDFNSGVGPACLPFKYRATTFLGSLLEALGWGTTEFGGPVSTKLMEVALNVVDINRCSQAYPSNNVNSQQICTLTPGKDTCQRDSGGPLLFTDPNNIAYLVGIVSYGSACASGVPSVSTRVTNYLDWIVANTPDQNYCVKS